MRCIICACNGVGEKSILDGIGTQGLNSVEQIKASMDAGTSFGSCIPDIKGLLASCGKNP